MNVGLPEAIAVVAGLGPALGVWITMRERMVRLETKLEKVQDAASVQVMIGEAIAKSRHETVEEMRREDGRVAAVDGDRDERMLRLVERLEGKIESGFSDVRRSIHELSNRVSEDHATLEALSKHAKKSDPHFKIPTMVTRSPPASESLEALDDPPGRYRR